MARQRGNLVRQAFQQLSRLAVRNVRQECLTHGNAGAARSSRVSGRFQDQVHSINESQAIRGVLRENSHDGQPNPQRESPVTFSVAGEPRSRRRWLRWPGSPRLFPALAGPPQPGDSFAHKYTPVYGETAGKTNLALMVHAPSFQTLIEAQPDQAAGSALPPGSSAAFIRERRPRLSVRPPVSRSGSSSVPGRASSCASAIGRSTPVCWRPRPARWRLWSPTATTCSASRSAIVPCTTASAATAPGLLRRISHTEEGFWLLWADAIAENLSHQVPFGKGEVPGRTDHRRFKISR